MKHRWDLLRVSIRHHSVSKSMDDILTPESPQAESAPHAERKINPSATTSM
jgi:hypothetical protein